ncbi:hypothetical protein ACWD1Y_42285 [Streptomyces sp. NPDC002814]
MVALSSFMLSIVALRLTAEQARAHLFPAPSVFTDPGARGIVLRNFGTGAMLNIWIEITLIDPGRAPVTITRYIPNLSQGESAVLVDAEPLGSIALMEVRAQLNFENIQRRATKETIILSADQLGSLGD